MGVGGEKSKNDGGARGFEKWYVVPLVDVLPFWNTVQCWGAKKRRHARVERLQTPGDGSSGTPQWTTWSFRELVFRMPLSQAGKGTLKRRTHWTHLPQKKSTHPPPKPPPLRRNWGGGPRPQTRAGRWGWSLGMGCVHSIQRRPLPAKGVDVTVSEFEIQEMLAT